MTPALRYRLIIFDFDGTLADTADWFRGVFNEVAHHFHFRTVTSHDLDNMRQMETHEVLRFLGIPFWKVPFIARHARKLMRRDVANIRMFPGTPQLLSELAAAGAVIAVVSSNAEANVREVLGGQVAHISYFACGAGLFRKSGKFKKVMKALRMSPAETLSIGDESRDIDAARAVGVAAGAVVWGYSSEDLLRTRAPSVVFQNMGEITKFASVRCKKIEGEIA